MARVAVVTRLTRREKEALRVLAKSEQRSMSNCVRLLVRRELEEQDLLDEPEWIKQRRQAEGLA